LFCFEYHPQIKGEHPGLSIGDVAKKLGEMWNNTAADDKQPCEKKAVKLKKYEKNIAATELKENLMQRKRVWSRLKGARKRRKRKMRGRMKRVRKRRERKTKMMMNKLVLEQVFSCL
jgi:high mobility group protein B1